MKLIQSRRSFERPVHIVQGMNPMLNVYWTLCNQRLRNPMRWDGVPGATHNLCKRCRRKQVASRLIGVPNA